MTKTVNLKDLLERLSELAKRAGSNYCVAEVNTTWSKGTIEYAVRGYVEGIGWSFKNSADEVVADLIDKFENPNGNEVGDVEAPVPTEEQPTAL